MIPGLADFALPFLRNLDPEKAHELTLRALEAGLYPRQSMADDPRLAQTVWGLGFSNPVGIAAGFDKGARVPEEILNSGFGFAEIGTVTPQPQPGNPRPRIFRLPADKGMINRLGFNSEGHAAVLARMKRLGRRGLKGVVGVNIGANKDSGDRDADYVAGLEIFAPVADYLTVNISSPNTPGLRDFHALDELDRLLGKLMTKRNGLTKAGGAACPVTVKLSPDIADEEVAPICDKLLAHKVDGIIVSNTTLDRPNLTGLNGSEAGGLSGAPLFQRSTRLLAKVYVHTRGAIPLIGVGGITSGATALGKIEAGASLIQLYTGLVYEGPGLVGRIKSALVAGIERAGTQSIDGLIGSKADEWSQKSLN
ncbi:MAG: quinone-dependent dihydroorotate dehydrogenase [Hyphomicrobiaceae bacterium]|nr:quinone-dependent dihydroorotate dehydrogenase [Hyphomicrobiaceae bacterium]